MGGMGFVHWIVIGLVFTGVVFVVRALIRRK